MTTVLAFLATFGICAASAVIPFLNAELYLITASAMSPPEMVVPLIAAAALGQMTGKSFMYLAGVGALELPSARLRRMVVRVKQRYSEGGASRSALSGGIILLSATVGLPPFYVVSIACGLIRIPFALFFGLGLAGRLTRFAIVVLAPQLIKDFQ